MPDQAANPASSDDTTAPAAPQDGMTDGDPRTARRQGHTPAPPTQNGGILETSAWLSENPDKAWVEKLFLAYSPCWMISMGVMVLTGWDKTFGDLALLTHAFGTALPLLVIPSLLARRHTDKPWHHSYWFKANLYLLIFSFFASYFGSEYFFDLLGMVYVYPNAATTLDAALVGSGTQTVPLIMYPYAYVYFSTYHATANIALRRLRRLPLPKPTMAILFPIFVFAIAYFWSWLETKAMANPLMATSFYYKSLDRMLTYGSAIYGIYFVCSFPIYYHLDETTARSWSILETCAAALSASILTIFGLDLATHYLGAL